MRSPCIALMLLAATVPTPPPAPFVTPGFVQKVVADSLDRPTAMAITPDGRILVCEQDGRVRLIKRGRLLPIPFLAVPTIAVGEQGLLGIALDPEFATNRRMYVTFTVPAPARRQVVARCVAAGDVAKPGSLEVLFECDENHDSLHVGGGLAVGTDGRLYLGTGDNEQEERSQSLRTTHGKVLRITRDGAIPPDNPFLANTLGAARAIWARGLRNAFGIAVEPGTGRVFVDDVGGARFEEVNEGRAGANYGWPLIEGPAKDERFVAPLHAYDHQMGCAITRGTFYESRAHRYPDAWRGRYFFAEYCAGEIRWIDPANPARSHRFAATLAPGPVDLAVGAEGDLYYLIRGSADPGGASVRSPGKLVRISPAATPAKTR